MQGRTIVHFDLDAFFASVEQLEDPRLRGHPVVVGGDPEGRGVVAAASYEARAFGVHSAQPARIARQLCPTAVFLPTRHDLYHAYSRRVFAIAATYTDLMQPLSIDEAFLDLSLQATPLDAATAFKQQVRAEIGLTVSIGVAANKLVAKIASDLQKPDGFVTVTPGQEAAFLAPLPASKLWGVGPRTAQRLQEMGIRTIGDLARMDVANLAASLGTTHARELVQRAHGQDESPVTPDRQAKSISDETTFPTDVHDARELWRVLREQSATCAGRLHRHGLAARTVGVKLRFGDFRTITRSLTLPAPTDSDREIATAVALLMRQTWAPTRRPLRLVGVRVSNLLSPPPYRQLGLFDNDAPDADPPSAH